MAKHLYIGVMSGTSLDGIDTVLVETDNNSFKTIESFSTEFNKETQNQIFELCRSGENEIEKPLETSWLHFLNYMATIVL